MDIDTGVIGEVPVDLQEVVDRPDVEAEGLDDSKVEKMLAATMADPGRVVAARWLS